MSSVSAGLLKTAVHQDSLMTRQGMLQRMFSLWFNGFVYNQIWEDPEVDIEALELTPESRIFTISSGGCNLLNYLVEKPEKIVAVDLNQYHMNLTRLKLASLEHLPDYKSFFDFFGLADKPQNIENYYQYIQPHMDEKARTFWEKGSLLRRATGKARIKYFKKNLYYYARFGRFMRLLHRISKMTKYKPERILQAQTIAEQEQIFNEEIAPFFDNWLVKKVGNMRLAVFSLGIPPQQHEFMKEESKGNLINLYRERVRHLACDFPIQTNYFAWQGFSLRYDSEKLGAVPEYLKPENYDDLKQNLHRVETHVTSLIDYLKSQPNNSLDRFVFLDSQDWMNPEVLTGLWQEVARVGKPGTRIIFRTASIDSPIETDLPPELRKLFVYEEERSKELYKKDRSAIYGGFHIYSMPSKPNSVDA
ncbi:DUF3419 family protein [Candidatus Albibeggiatoa sp. nov. BB20]|uniref:DUF3419 family protein n=1 Tax=Candidatus Albibeggiatoa sp. nov. BB20 TaxID=3162723 RepID=UPI0033658F22